MAETGYVERKAIFEEWAKHPASERKSIAFLIQAILYTPDADVVEVVRCRECKLWKSFLCPYSIATNADDFCSYGARKDG